MLVPTLPTLSCALSRNLPKPFAIAEVIVMMPFQLLPEPDSVIGVLLPIGAWNISVGVVADSLLKVKLTLTFVLLVVCTGDVGTVTIAPVGGVVSMVKAAPAGAPLKTLPT